MRITSSIQNPATQPLLDPRTLDRLLSIVDASQRSLANTSHEAAALHDPAPQRELIGSFYPHRQSKGGAQ